MTSVYTSERFGPVAVHYDRTDGGVLRMEALEAEDPGDGWCAAEEFLRKNYLTAIYGGPNTYGHVSYYLTAALPEEQTGAPWAGRRAGGAL